MPDAELQYDVLKYIMENGRISDMLRMIAAGYNVSDDQRSQILTDLEGILNEEGGVPFDLNRENPSSVKETAEILLLVAKYREQHPTLVGKMVGFLVSRQKGDGGFSETLNLDPHIEDKWGASTGREWYPVGKSITWLTAKALEALCSIEYKEEDRLRRARDFLIYRQHECGHWPDFEGQDESDPLATGNILCALRAVGVSEDHRVLRDGRAALFQHLMKSLENESPYDMVDLTSVGRPISDLETEVIRKGVGLVVRTQNDDGGWSQMGSKKSDPELSSILGLVVKTCDCL